MTTRFTTPRRIGACLPLLWALPMATSAEPEAPPLATYTVNVTTGATLRLPGHGGGPIYLRDRAGNWVEAPSTTGTPGVAEVALKPGDLRGGATQIVLNKPAWVELNDNEAPRVLSVKCGDEGISVETGSAQLPAITPGQTIEIQVADEINRVSPSGTSATLNGAALGGADGFTLQRDAADPKRATLWYLVPDELGFGLQDLQFRIRDESPASPTAELSLHCRRFGVEVFKDGERVLFHTPGASFAYEGTMAGAFACDVTGSGAVRLAVQGKGAFQHPDKPLAPPEFVIDEPTRKVVNLKPSLVFDNTTDEAHQFSLEFLCETRADWPGLLVTTRMTALEDLPNSYLFWSGFLAGDHYLGSDGTKGEWHPRYADIKPQGWIYLSPTVEGRPGSGVATNGELSEYLGRSLLIFARPKKATNVKKGHTTEVSWYYLPAASPDEVKAATEGIEFPERQAATD